MDPELSGSGTSRSSGPEPISLDSTYTKDKLRYPTTALETGRVIRTVESEWPEAITRPEKIKNTTQEPRGSAPTFLELSPKYFKWPPTTGRGFLVSQFYILNLRAACDPSNRTKHGKQIQSPRPPADRCVRYDRLSDYPQYDPSTINSNRWLPHSPMPCTMDVQSSPPGFVHIPVAKSLLRSMHGKATKLSDDFAAVAITMYSAKERYNLFRSDFDIQGLLFIERFPQGQYAPRVWPKAGDTDIDGNVIARGGWYYLIQRGVEPLTSGGRGETLAWRRAKYWPPRMDVDFFCWHKYSEVVEEDREGDGDGDSDWGISEQKKGACEYFAKYLR